MIVIEVGYSNPRDFQIRAYVEGVIWTIRNSEIARAATNFIRADIVSRYSVLFRPRSDK